MRIAFKYFYHEIFHPTIKLILLIIGIQYNVFNIKFNNKSSSLRLNQSKILLKLAKSTITKKFNGRNREPKNFMGGI